MKLYALRVKDTSLFVCADEGYTDYQKPSTDHIPDVFVSLTDAVNEAIWIKRNYSRDVDIITFEAKE